MSNTSLPAGVAFPSTSDPAEIVHAKCAVCAKDEAEIGAAMQQCSGCKLVCYCSTDCQKLDWKSHKIKCVKGKLHRPEPLKEQDPRVVLFRDLYITAHTYGHFAFAESAYFGLDLDKDINRASTHFLAITLSRNPGATNPRTLHAFVDSAVLPLSALEARADGAALVADFRRRAKNVTIFSLEPSLFGNRITKNVKQLTVGDPTETSGAM
ncbi:MYND-type domain-containing protein [Mycena chlorophos]|uniref:MYND-type domain-containing protein n=1 Tax=Mycena chlorophos TaxID=658473 RepID=A0A8H6TIS2_MYCCL|nr:MYND-type domain-containing protein [Mycena chlorophos]